MQQDVVVVERFGRVVRISLNRPEMRNAQNTHMLDGLDAAFAQAEKDADCNVVILAAKGDHFSAGHDMKEAMRDRSDLSVEQRWAHEMEGYFNYSMRIRDFSKPTIAQVQGACIAAGFMIANMCDLMVASDDAYFSDPVGQTLGASAVEVLVHPWVLGARHAKEFLFTGAKLSAQDGYRLGMINRVVTRDALEAQTLELATKIADAPPFGMRLIKRTLNRTLDIQGFRNALEAHFEGHQLSHVTAEFQEIRAQRKASSATGKVSFGRDV